MYGSPAPAPRSPSCSDLRARPHELLGDQNVKAYDGVMDRVGLVNVPIEKG